MGWFSRLFEDKPCEACEVLREALALERARYQELLRVLLPTSSPYNQGEQSFPPARPVSAMHIPWRVKREMLEKEERKKAQIKSTEELEKELQINGNDS